MDIRHDQTDSKGRYWVTAPNGDMATMTYSRAGESLIIIDHTEVPDSLRGQGYGAALVARAVRDAREQSRRIMPLCPFAASQFRRNADWQDVLS